MSWNPCIVNYYIYIFCGFLKDGSCVALSTDLAVWPAAWLSDRALLRCVGRVDGKFNHHEHTEFVCFRVFLLGDQTVKPNLIHAHGPLKLCMAIAVCQRKVAGDYFPP